MDKVENNKFTINLNYVFFVCLALLLMGSYGLLTPNQTKVFNVIALSFIAIYTAFMIFSTFLLMKISKVRQKGLPPTPPNYVTKTKSTRRAYIFLMLECAFALAISFSPKSQEFRLIIYFLSVKWLVMFVNNFFMIRTMKKIHGIK